MGTHSLEVEFFDSVYLSWDYRQISASVGPCWTFSRLKPVMRSLNETCGDNTIDFRVLSTSQVVTAEQMQAVLLGDCSAIKQTVYFLMIAGKKSSVFAQQMNT